MTLVEATEFERVYSGVKGALLVEGVLAGPKEEV